MGKLIIAYSYTGKPSALAQRIAREQSADYVQAKDTERPGTLKAYALGGLSGFLF